MNKNSNTRLQKRNLHKIFVPIAMILAVILSFVGGYFSRYLFDGREASVTKELVDIIGRFGYVFDPDTGEVRELTEKDYANALINGLLDDYSSYYTQEEYSEIIAKSKGNRSGIGISVYKDSAVIFKVIGNSPAESAGLKSGDKIISLTPEGKEKIPVTDDDDISGALDLVKIGEQITVEYERGGETKALTVCKKDYEVSYVTYFDSENSYRFKTDGDGKLAGVENINDGMSALAVDTAYIKLDQFEGGAANQIRSALDYMKKRGRTKLILDLRDNGGGYMSVLTDIAGCLIYNGGKTDTLVAVAESKSGKEEFRASFNAFNTDITAISVLANENTASASECLIGAMLCYGDCFSKENLIIEKNSAGVAKTYGKGIMQTTYGLISGGAFKLTTARVLLPDYKTCIHGVGFIANGNNSVDRGGAAISRAVEALSQTVS